MRTSLVCVVGVLALLPACYGTYYYPPGPPVASQGPPVVQPTPPGMPMARQKTRFGYTEFAVGVAGLPGCDDIRPGTAYSVTVPPAGVFVTAIYLGLLAALASADNSGGGLYIDGDFMFPGYAWEQGVTTGDYGPMRVNGIGMDAVFSWGTAEDLTYGGDIYTFAGGLGLRCIGGFWGGSLWRFVAGFEIIGIDFENRAYAVNFGPYLGGGLEFMLAPEVSFAMDIRYAFLEGDVPEYDHWQCTGGLVFYW